MNEYTLKIDKNFEDMAFIVAPDGRVITTGSKVATSHVMVNLLNAELATKNALIAEQAAEIARKTELLKRIYDIPYIQEIAIAIKIEDELGMNDPENSPKFAEHFKALQSPAPLAPEASSEVTPKYSAGDLVFYYGDVMVVQSSDLIKGLYAYELQRLDSGDILGAMIAETELDPA
jgi:hypothetical protein